MTNNTTGHPSDAANARELRDELNALHRGQAWPKALSVLAFAVAVGALLLPAVCG